MIERKVVNDKFIQFEVAEFVRTISKGVPIKEVVFEKTPMGEKITIHTSAPGLVIGRQGSNIKKLTQSLKDRFNYENPMVKISEVKSPDLSAKIVAKGIANNLSRFGSKKFKMTGFRALTNVMLAGAMGVEIRITGKIPSSRSKSWRFVKGYIKKTGYVSDVLVDKCIESVTLKSGVVGIKVSIMLPGTPLPDKFDYKEVGVVLEEEAKLEELAENSETVVETEVLGEKNKKDSKKE